MARLGETLREARKRKNLSTSELAAATRIKVQIVEDLERDDFSRISATIYGKGFLKLMAEQLDLDPGPLIEEFLERYAGTARTPWLFKEEEEPRPAEDVPPAGVDVHALPDDLTRPPPAYFPVPE